MKISRDTEELKTLGAEVLENYRFTVRNSAIETADTTLAFEKAKAAAAAFPESPISERPQAAYDAGLYRSLRYAVVSGVYCHQHAIDSQYRSLYEAFRLWYPLSTK